MVALPKCVLDPSVINADSIGKLSDLGLSFFADLCGRNRGVMVLPAGNSTDQQHPGTFGCTKFPDDFAIRAGLSTNVPIVDANAIPKSWHEQTTTASETLQLLDYFVQNVYTSSPKVQEDPYACNVNGLAVLECDGTATTTTTTPPIRAATLAGLFTYVPWATNANRLTIDQARDFYTAHDFIEMKRLGLNAVQIPLPLHMFHHHHHPPGQTPLAVGESADPPHLPWLDLLAHVLSMADHEGLQAILVLEPSENDVAQDNAETIAAAVRFAVDHRNVVFALTLPTSNPNDLNAARAAATTMNLFLPILQDDLKHLQSMTNHDPHVFAALDLGHTGTVADVASSTSQEDRMKLFYHESLACVLRAPLEYANCYQTTKVFVAKGFDLAIDDCVTQKYDPTAFVDYGQCGRLEETVDSHWWKTHRASFFDRQQFSYEQGMGWSFAAWKLYSNNGALDQPETWLSLKDVAAAGLVPDGLTLADNLACLNQPASDFMLGDATLSPVPAPPPDCGNGWWNTTIHDCSYWIPPPTMSPTQSPTCAGLVETVCPTAPNSHVMLIGAISAILGLIVGCVITKFSGNRRQGYQEVASSIIV